MITEPETDGPLKLQIVKKADSVVIKEGFLWKLSIKKKQWKQRYVVLFASELVVKETMDAVCC